MGHVVVVVPELTRELEEFATGLLGFELFGGAEAKRLDDVGRAYDLAQERNLPITLSLGRHTMDTLVSFYMGSPSGFVIDFGAGGALLGDDFVQVNQSGALGGSAATNPS